MTGNESPKKATLKKRIEQWLKFTVLPPLGALVIRGIKGSMRLEQRGYEPVDALYREKRSIILAFWHAQQLMIPFGYRGPGSHVLISQHGDGEIIARIIARFGHEAVRGSSTRGGAGALRSLIKLGRSGKDVVVTPDGPKGPRQVAKLGVIQLAKATGLPIVPLGFACSKKNSSRAGIASWCRTHFPAGSSSGALRLSSRARPMRPCWRRPALNWNQL
ncbi:MAG: lysophospholipid acyltransferase family protein [Nitrospira sp.]